LACSRFTSASEFFILSRSERAAERYRFLTMPSSPKLSGVPEYGLAVFLDVLIEPNAGEGGPYR